MHPSIREDWQRRLRSHVFSLLVLSAVLFAAEVLEHAVILPMVHLDVGKAWPLIDATVLVSIASPLLYVLVYRPMRQTIEERGTVAESLRRKQLEHDRVESIGNVGSFCVDLKSGEYEWSDQLYRMLGLHPGEVRPHFDAYLEYVHPDDKDSVRRRGYEALSGSRDFNEYYRIVKENREIRHVHTVAVRETDESGTARLLYGFTQDITEHRNADMALVESQKRLFRAQRMEAIGKLAAGMAHEVRNPLNSIMVITEALEKELKNEGEMEVFLTHIRSQVHRLSSLMTELLELGRPMDKLKLSRESLTAITSGTLDLWRSSAGGRAHELVISHQLDADAVFPIVDMQKIQQALLNIIENAAQNSPEGSEIVLSAVPADDHSVDIQVIDRGSGIRSDVLPDVFEAFFTTRRGGTGLGLSIVKHIVEAHGGRVSFSNNDPPPGATAHVCLPLSPGAPE